MARVIAMAMVKISVKREVVIGILLVRTVVVETAETAFSKQKFKLS